jgi:2-hydroxychromene-2-carboxylate isomerase
MKRPRLYFSFRSPFSWLLIGRLRRQAPLVWSELEAIPYWEPDARMSEALAGRGASIRYAPMSKAKHLYILQDVKRLSAGLGLTMRWPVDVTPWWEPSHLGWLVARRHGREDAFYDAVVEARWGRGEDISQPDVVADAARAAGLDGAELLAAADGEAIRAQGTECLGRAYEDDVFGVPYLIAGWQRFWGYDRLDAFLEAVGASGAAPAGAGVPAAVLGSPYPYDTDTAGGCG